MIKRFVPISGLRGGADSQKH